MNDKEYILLLEKLASTWSFEMWAKEHWKLLDKLFHRFNKDTYKILDAGTGRASMGFLTRRYPNSDITGIVYPGDRRKIDSLIGYIEPDDKYKLIELDLFKYNSPIKYDIVLAHLLLGETSKFTNKNFIDMLDNIFKKIKFDYIVIVEAKEDPDVDIDVIFDYIADHGRILETIEHKRPMNKDLVGIVGRK